MKESFIERKFSIESLKTVKTVNTILEEYRRQGYRLSLRQLYYQLVARDYIPNTQRSYKNLGSLVSNARQAGLIDWKMIEDRNRETSIPNHWKNPADIITAAANSFKIDKWLKQPYHIEVMVEKDALSGILEPVCYDLDIGITANKGYSSSSTMYEIGKRLEKKYFNQNKKLCVIYLGDHDPSGIDMTRDIDERLCMYANTNDIEILRVALNWDQIEKWQPPENPAKEKDARFDAYFREFGSSSWELDAVEPVHLADLVKAAVYERRDEELWEEALNKQNEMKKKLYAFSNSYDESDLGEADE